MGVTLVEGLFDTFIDKMTRKTKSVRLFTWENDKQISVQVINYGATITSIKIPDKNGIIQDIVMGFMDLKGYKNPDNPYFGATIGRMANRIGFGEICYNDTIINVSKNFAGKHQLHGGFIGFDKVLWEPHIVGNKLILSYYSADGEEGYPGDLIVHSIFELTNSNEFIIEYKATTTKPTFVNMTNHSYFNLAGHNKGASELYKHVICINADQITKVNDDSIPNGELIPVESTIFDLQTPQILGDVIHKVPNNPGYNHNFCINKGSEQENAFIARVYHSGSGRVLEIYSNQPGVQFYTADYLPENPEVYKGDKKDSKSFRLRGKDGDYYKHGALCLETQNWPDAPNHRNFPKAVLNPGELYYHSLVYKFSIRK